MHCINMYKEESGVWPSRQLIIFYNLPAINPPPSWTCPNLRAKLKSTKGARGIWASKLIIIWGSSNLSLQTNNYKEAWATWVSKLQNNHSSLQTNNYQEAWADQASKVIIIRRLEQLEPFQTSNNKGARATQASKLMRRLEQATRQGGSAATLTLIFF
jgi:uncharacterized protein (DUF2126 family)